MNSLIPFGVDLRMDDLVPRILSDVLWSFICAVVSGVCDWCFESDGLSRSLFRPS